MAGEVEGIGGFARKLASSDKRVRDKAINLLVRWFCAQPEAGEEELTKIWKALFYCVWHADKVAVQEELADKVASLLESLNPHVSHQYMHIFLRTIRREWAGIDRLRLDKFCSLVRKCMCHVFIALEKSGWESQRTESYMQLLRDTAFLAGDSHAAEGMNLHFADIYLDELRKFLPISAPTLLLLLEPFFSTLARGSYKPLLERIRVRVFQVLLEEGTRFAKSRLSKRVGEEEQGGKESLGSTVLSLPLSARLFELASSASTPQANRRVLYQLYDAFARLDGLASASLPLASESHTETAVSSLGGSRAAKLDANGLEHEVGVVGDAVEAKDIISSKAGRKGSKKSNAGNAALIAQADAELGMERKGVNDTVRHDVSEELAAGSVVKTARQGKGSIRGTKDKARKGREESGKVRKKRGRVEKDGEDVACVKNKGEEGLAAHPCSSSDDGMVAGFSTPVDGAAGDHQLFHVGIADSLIANLEKKIAAMPSVNGKGSPNRVGGKRKRKRESPFKEVSNGEGGGAEAESGGGELENPKKRVRFVLKNNLVWKPHSGPLPPQSMRTPPSATPRGSALKAGVLPGPIQAWRSNSPQPKKKHLALVRRTRSMTRTLKSGKSGRSGRG